jgi:hypothetical protein
MVEQAGSMAVVTAFLVVATVTSWARQRGEPSVGESTAAASIYEITFKQGEPVKGVGAAPAFRLPFQCTPDGTVFITTVQPLSAGGSATDTLSRNPLLLISIAPSGEAHSFPLNPLPDLYDVHQISEAGSESKVVFLVSALDEKGQEEGTGGDRNGRRHSAEGWSGRHAYLIAFDRDGHYQKKTQLDPAFRITHISPFPSGSFLAYGYDESDYSPKLAMLKDDGTLLKFLDLPKGEVPKSLRRTEDGSDKGPRAYLARAEFFPQGQYIYFLQPNSDYPLLRVSAAGAIESIKPKLPDGHRIETLIPSDEGLYAIIRDWGSPGKPGEESVFELDDQGGAPLRQLQMGKGESAYELACVYGDKFLVFHHGEGQLIPLVGTARASREAPPKAITDR